MLNLVIANRCRNISVSEINFKKAFKGAIFFNMFSAAAATKSLQSCLTLSDPMDCSPPGSSTHGIFQARVLEWGAIALIHCKLSNRST